MSVRVVADMNHDSPASLQVHANAGRRRKTRSEGEDGQYAAESEQFLAPHVVDSNLTPFP